MSKPVRLAKQDEYSFSYKMEQWAYRNAHILLPLFIIIALVLFILLCFAICGASATESGIKYNQFERLI